MYAVFFFLGLLTKKEVVEGDAEENRKWFQHPVYLQ